MRHLFVGQDPANYVLQTRSIRLKGRATSVRLEKRFWEVLDTLAGVQGMATPKFMALLHEEAIETHGQVDNFASLLRCCCVNFLDQNVDHEALKVQVIQCEALALS